MAKEELIGDEEIRALYETVMHVDHALYRPIRVGNNAQLLLKILNHALELKKFQETVISPRPHERPSGERVRKEESQTIKEILMQVSGKGTVCKKKPEVTARKDEPSDFIEFSSTCNDGYNLTQLVEEVDADSDNFDVDKLSFWAKGFLLKLFSVESELLRRALKSFQLSDILDFQKLSQRRKRMVQERQKMQDNLVSVRFNVGPVADDNENDDDVANIMTSLSQANSDSLLCGTKNYRVIKQRELFSETEAKAHTHTLEFEETNAAIPLTLRESEFCKYIGVELRNEMLDLLMRLENRLKTIATTSDDSSLLSFIFHYKSLPANNPRQSLKALSIAYNDVVYQLMCVIIYIHFFVGVIVGKGYGVEKREDVAFQHFIFSADLGLDLSQGEVGHFYDSDHQVVYDFERDYECGYGNHYSLDYNKVHDPLIITTLPSSESIVDQKKRLRRMHVLMARRYYRLSADQGYAITQSIYALLMEVVDAAVSVEYYEKAATQGLREALFNLGNSYSHGIGVTVDSIKAIAYYERAAELGDPDAMLNVAVAYVNGTGGVEKNCEKAVAYFRIAAEQGCSMIAWYNLGIMYLRGTGVPEDIGESTRCFITAADMGYPAAQQRVAACFEVGHGCEINKQKAAKYCLQAAENGITICMRRIIIKLLEADGIERDLSVAFFYLLKLFEIYTAEGDEDGAVLVQQQIATAYNQGWSIRHRFISDKAKILCSE